MTDTDPPTSEELAAAAQRLRPELAARLKTLAHLDDDGKHVNVVHYCTDRKRMFFTLPWPNWKAVDGLVQPSMQCDACGFHDHLSVGGSRD